MKTLRLLIDMVNASDLSVRKKHRMRLALFNPHIRSTVMEQLEAGSSDDDARAELGLGPLMGKPLTIDWDNFPWDEAKEFWLEILKAIAEIILSVI